MAKVNVDEEEMRAISAGESQGCLEQVDTEKSAEDTIAAIERTNKTE